MLVHKVYLTLVFLLASSYWSGSTVLGQRGGSCTNGRIFISCGTSCPLTCDNYENPPRFCTTNCNPDPCFCPNGMVELGAGCVQPCDCPNLRNTPSCPQQPTTQAPLPTTASPSPTQSPTTVTTTETTTQLQDTTRITEPHNTPDRDEDSFNTTEMVSVNSDANITTTLSESSFNESSDVSQPQFTVIIASSVAGGVALVLIVAISLIVIIVVVGATRKGSQTLKTSTESDLENRTPETDKAQYYKPKQKLGQCEDNEYIHVAPNSAYGKTGQSLIDETEYYGPLYDEVDQGHYVNNEVVGAHLQQNVAYFKTTLTDSELHRYDSYGYVET